LPGLIVTPNLSIAAVSPPHNIIGLDAFQAKALFGFAVAVAIVTKL
jgi:hypothetical protein